jgi:hypothetical protein
MDRDAFAVVSNAAETAAALRLGASMLGPLLNATVTKHGYALQRQIKANASGRPGPRVQTGDYRRSIRVKFGTTSRLSGERGAISATVGTDNPQGRRLEHGFMGMTDSLGRLFHQPPYPHFGPAFDFIAPQFEAAVANDVDVVLAAIAGL